MLLLSLTHFFVDAVCASAIYSMVNVDLGIFILLYNTLAFSGQALWGLAADRFSRQKYAAAVSCGMVVLGALLPVSCIIRTVLLGVGNCGFHVSGGTHVLRSSGHRAAPLGVFVAPGSVGLVLGTITPALVLPLAVGLGFCGLGIALMSEHRHVRSQGRAEYEGAPIWVSLLLLFAVAVRSFGGFAVPTPWKTGNLLIWIAAAAVFLGKLAGGFFMDRVGPEKAILLTLPLASVLLGFFWGFMGPSVLGQLLLNMTMPVTLWLLYQAMPESPGLSFGLAAASLWPGALTAQVVTADGTGKNFMLFSAFFLGGAAAFLAARLVHRNRNSLKTPSE